MGLHIGDVVLIILSGGFIVGTITAIRIGRRVSDGQKDVIDHLNESTPAPDYIELDGFIQVHPSKVTQVIRRARKKGKR